MIVSNGRCRGILMYFLKSGSAISTHNACLCPLKPLALILIRAVLSTSSLASQTHKAYTHRSKKHMMRKLGEVPILFFCSWCLYFCALWQSRVEIQPTRKLWEVTFSQDIFKVYASCLWAALTVQGSRKSCGYTLLILQRKTAQIFPQKCNPSSLLEDDSIHSAQKDGVPK